VLWRLTLALTSAIALQTFSSRALGVRVDVLVMDGGKPVAGLTARDFELRDNGVPQRVEVVDAADVPINTVFALDTSASIAGRPRTDLIAAGETILDRLKPVDRASLVTFDHAVTAAIPLTDDLSAVRAALRGIQPNGRTSVMDGVYVALAYTVDQPGRFLLVVCTDGADTTSWLRGPEVLDASRRTNAVVYAVTTSDGRRSEPLQRLSDATGGQMLQVSSSRDLRQAFERILTEFRTRYVLAYSPEGVEPAGFHRLEVTVPRRRATVKARAGYIGIGASKQP
jgi:VWFA-related protein